MKTTFFKKDDIFVVQLAVSKLHVQYTGNSQYPFLCEIISDDNKYFSCAVNEKNIDAFLLYEKGNVLSICLKPMYPQALTMAVVECVNTSSMWKNIGKETELINGYFVDLKLIFGKAHLLHLPYTQDPGYPVLQNIYYCIACEVGKNYIPFYMPAQYVQHILGSEKGDIVKISLNNFEHEGGFVLQSYENTTRNIESINQEVLKL